MAVRNSPKIFSHVLVLISLVWTCGCGGNSFHSVPPPQNLEFIYVGNSPGISAFQIDSSGKLQELPSSPLTALQDAIPVVADPQSRFILLGTYPVLFPAVIDSSHALSFTSKAKLPEGHFLMDPLGRFFFDAPDAGGKFTTSTPIHVYSVTADLSFPEVPGSPFEAGILPAAIDPGGKFIFGFSVDAALNVNAIATIQIGATGTLTTISTVPVANKVQYTYVFASVNASGDFLYVSSFQNQNYQYDLTVYKISATGALTPTASEPNLTPKSVPGGSFKFIGFDPADRFVYSEDCNSTACYLDTLPIDQTTGAVSPTPLFSLSGFWPLTAFDSSVARLFTVGTQSDCTLGISNVLTIFRVSTTGQLQGGETQMLGSCPAGGLVVTH